MAAPPYRVKALFDYSSPHEDDLNFSNGQLINVVDEEDADWYYGEYEAPSGEKHQGLFPRNFVERYEPTTPPRPTRPQRSRHDAEAKGRSSDERPRASETESTRASGQADDDGEKPNTNAASIHQDKTAEEAPPAKTERPPDPSSTVPPMPPAEPTISSITTSDETISKKSKPAPPPVSEKPSGGSFRDRIAAFNQTAAPPITPVKPGGFSASSSSGFIKKPYVPPPPSRNAYVPPPREPPPQRVFKREDRATDESIDNNTLSGGASSSQGEAAEAAAKPTSLKDRIALLQKQQLEQASRLADAASKKEKPKKPPNRRLEVEEDGSEDIKDSDHIELPSKDKASLPRNSNDGAEATDKSQRALNEAIPTTSVEETRAESLNDVAQAGTKSDSSAEDEEMHQKESAAAPPPPPRKSFSTDSDGESMPHKETVSSPIAENTTEAEANGDESDEDIDPEVRRRMEIRERMAKMSGGMGMAGMFGPIGGIAVPKKPRASHSSARSQSEEQERGSSNVPQATPMPLPGLPSVQRLQSPETIEALEQNEELNDELNDIIDHSIQRQGPAPSTDEAPEEPIMPLSRRSTAQSRSSQDLATRQAPPVPQSKVPKAPPVPTGRPVPPPPPSESRSVPPPPPLVPRASYEDSDSDYDAQIQSQNVKPQPTADETTPSSRRPPPIPPMSPPSAPPVPPREASMNSYDFSKEKESSPTDSLPEIGSALKRESTRSVQASPSVPPPVSRAPPPPPPPQSIPQKEHGESFGDRLEASDGELEETTSEGIEEHEAEGGQKTYAGDEISIHHQGLPSLGPPSAPPPIPGSRAPRAAPPPPPPTQAPRQLQSNEGPRGPPPPPPISKENSYVGIEDSGSHEISHFDTMPAHDISSNQMSTENEADTNHQGTKQTIEPVSRNAPPTPASASRPAPRKSLDVPQMSTSRRSADASRPSMEQTFIADDVDLGAGSLWWTQRKMPPPVFQNRSDIAIEVDETGSRSTTIKHVYVLFMDYSQTIVTARFDESNPSTVELSQRHEPAPSKLRQDQLENAHIAFGARLAERVNSRINSIVGNGTPYGLVTELLASLPDALPSVGTRAFGALVYTNLANASVQQNDEIRAGDIITFRNAKLQGHRGGLKQKYNVEIGKPDHVGIVVDWDGTKKKVRAWEQGRESKKVKIESFKLDDLRSGEVKVWRVVSREWVGWGGGR